MSAIYYYLFVVSGFSVRKRVNRKNEISKISHHCWGNGGQRCYRHYRLITGQRCSAAFGFSHYCNLHVETLLTEVNMDSKEIYRIVMEAVIFVCGIGMIIAIIKCDIILILIICATVIYFTRLVQSGGNDGPECIFKSGVEVAVQDGFCRRHHRHDHRRIGLPLYSGMRSRRLGTRRRFPGLLVGISGMPAFLGESKVRSHEDKRWGQKVPSCCITQGTSLIFFRNLQNRLREK